MCAGGPRLWEDGGGERTAAPARGKLTDVRRRKPRLPEISAFSRQKPTDVGFTKITSVSF